MTNPVGQNHHGLMCKCADCDPAPFKTAGRSKHGLMCGCPKCNPSVFNALKGRGLGGNVGKGGGRKKKEWWQ